MRKYVEKLLTRPKKNSSDLRNEFKLEFFNQPEHQWITTDKHLNRCFHILIDLLNGDMITWFSKHQLAFVVGGELLACAVTPRDNKNVIIVFPDLIKLLQSAAPMNGVAILAHEIGHIYLNHGERDISPLAAQIEADNFAWKLGLGHELYDVLLDFKNELYCEQRLNALERRIKSASA